jgi:phenylalanyl-tRNA synthetase alpha chain
MKEKIQTLREDISSTLETVSSADDLERFRVKFLARSGLIANLFDEMRAVPVDQKPEIGRMLNDLRSYAQAGYDRKKETLVSSGGESADRSLDLSLPGRRRWVGSKHPLTQTLEEIVRIFSGMGFQVATGPEIEDDYHNFGALNFPPDHPARDMQDTFFLTEDKNVLLRTHTSPVQIRVMETQKPPIRVVMPGRVYRNEAISARSYCLFHQVEGLYVDQGVTFSELKGTLVAFAKQFYGSGVKYKFRPTFFPFTEPSADMYITCFLCGGKGCRLCKNVGWLEILGAGMVHPHLYNNVGYDAERYTGYAFGMGIERIALLRYQIDDIRLFYENDIRFLRQF